MSNEENTIINFQVSIDLKKQAEERGKKLGLTLSNYMRFLIIKDLEKQ